MAGQVKINQLLSFIIGFVICTQGLAQSKLSEYDESIYRLSKYHCDQIKDKNWFGKYFSALHLKVLESSLAESLPHLAQLQSGQVQGPTDPRLVGLLGDLVHSDGFMLAMKQCFPNQNSHENFVLSLFWTQIIANFVSVYSLKYGIQATVHVISKFPTVFKQAIKLSGAFVMTVYVGSLRSTVDLETVKSMTTQQIDSRIKVIDEKLDSKLFELPASNELKREKHLLELKKALDLLN